MPGRPPQRSYDAIVLGGGTAGCVLAARLSEDSGREVCLVEAGPDYGAHGAPGWPADLLDGRLPADSHDWVHGDERLQAARVIGGCSSHNLCTVVRGAAADYDEWAGCGWSFATLAPYLDRAEAMLAPRIFPEAQLGPWYRRLCEAAGELDLPVHDQIDSPGAIEGLGRASFNLRGTVRWGAAFAWLDPARARPNLRIVSDTVADRVLVEDGSVRGAAVRGSAGAEELRAPLVVAAGGAYGSPAMLLRSGIGPERELGRHGIPVVEALPVGELLHDHFGVPVRWAAGEAMERLLSEHARRHGAQPTHGLGKLRSSECPAGVWDLMLVTAAFPRSGDPDRPGGHVLSASVMVMRPGWRGSVRLRSRDPARLPLVTEYSLDADTDMSRVLEGVGVMRRLARSRAVRGLVGEELSPGEDASPQEIRERGRSGLTAFFHPVATCRMGAVVDRFGRVNGVDGLRVADASIIPVIPRAGTHLTVLGLAEAVAEDIRRGG